MVSAFPSYFSISKWTWGPEQKQAFKDIQNTIACQVLLKYPDFIKPFDIYTDASDFQLGM
jgi:RNase H-like domain found in reverse transcriptase